MSHAFCRLLLAATRKEASAILRSSSRGWGITNSGTRSRPYYMVEGENGVIVWEGRACCAYDARHNAIVSIENLQPIDGVQHAGAST